MADNISESGAAAGLSDADRMLETARKFNNGRRNIGPLRTMFGALTTEVEAVEGNVQKAAQSLQAPKAKPSPLAPRI